MPYVDQGEANPMKIPPVVPWIAIVAASPLPAVLWYATYKATGLSLIGALLGAVAIGMAAKFTLRRDDMSVRIAAIVLAVLSCFAGYIWVDSTIWTPFMLGESVSRFFGDLMALIVTGFSAYIAFVLAAPRMIAPSQSV